MTMGTSLLRRIERHTSKPSMPGSMMSIRTTSVGWRLNESRASSPLSASSTTQPSSSRAILTAVRMRSSSSTARMRVPTAPSCPISAPIGPIPPSISAIGHRAIGARGEVAIRAARRAAPAAAAGPAGARPAPGGRPARGGGGDGPVEVDHHGPGLGGDEGAGGEVPRAPGSARSRRRPGRRPPSTGRARPSPSGGCRGSRARTRPSTWPWWRRCVGPVAEAGGDQGLGQVGLGRHRRSARRCGWPRRPARPGSASPVTTSTTTPATTARPGPASAAIDTAKPGWR